MIIYKIYKEMNAADTWRDPDDICIVELGYKQSLEDALTLVQEYIDKSFYQKGAEIHKSTNGSYYAIDVCSYGWTVKVNPIEVE